MHSFVYMCAHMYHVCIHASLHLHLTRFQARRFVYIFIRLCFCICLRFIHTFAQVNGIGRSTAAAATLKKIKFYWRGNRRKKKRKALKKRHLNRKGSNQGSRILNDKQSCTVLLESGKPQGHWVANIIRGILLSITLLSGP